MKGITKKVSMWLLVVVGAIIDELLKYSAETLGLSTLHHFDNCKFRYFTDKILLLLCCHCHNIIPPLLVYLFQPNYSCYLLGAKKDGKLRFAGLKGERDPQKAYHCIFPNYRMGACICVTVLPVLDEHQWIRLWNSDTVDHAAFWRYLSSVCVTRVIDRRAGGRLKHKGPCSDYICKRCAVLCIYL